ncbi:MAG: serine hydrolase [Clostridium sp.]
MKIIKKSLIFITLLSMVSLFIPHIYSFASSTPPEINAEGAMLIDAETNQILYSKNGDTQFYPASTTKVLTAIVVLEKTKLTDKVTIGKNPPNAEGTSIGIRKDEIYTIEDLLQGLLLMSGNDCATALAEHVSGSTEEFAKVMNEKAKSIGAKNSNFKNPSGLPDPEHLTTPYDLALIMKEALKFPDFIRISRINTNKLPPSNLDGNQLWLSNHNYLINKNSKYFYPNALTGKSGYTIEAKHTFAIAAEKDGRKLVASFIKASDKNQNYLDMANLFEYGFNNFTQTKLYSKGEVIDTIKVEEDFEVPLVASNDFYYTYENSKGNISKKLDFTAPDLLRKTVKKGEVLASAKVLVNNKDVGTLKLESNVDRVFDSTLGLKYSLLDNKFILGFLILFVLFLSLLFIRMRNIRKRKQAIRNKYKKYIKRN